MASCSAAAAAAAFGSSLLTAASAAACAAACWAAAMASCSAAAASLAMWALSGICCCRDSSKRLPAGGLCPHTAQVRPSRFTNEGCVRLCPSVRLSGCSVGWNVCNKRATLNKSDWHLASIACARHSHGHRSTHAVMPSPYVGIAANRLPSHCAGDAANQVLACLQLGILLDKMQPVSPDVVWV